MDDLIRLLRSSGCSLVLRDAQGHTTTHSQRGVRDLLALLDAPSKRLHGADVADKVVGRAAAALMVEGGVRRVWAEVLSRQAVPFFEQAGISYDAASIVEGIVRRTDDQSCPLEEITAPARTPAEAETLLRRHIEAMRKKENIQ